jgi:hypothetical protein
MKPKHWGGASAYDCAVAPFESRHVHPERILEDAGLTSRLDACAQVFAIGAGVGTGYSAGTIRQSLAGAGTRLECVVSLIPGRLAVCYGHAGEVRVCKAAEPLYGPANLNKNGNPDPRREEPGA